MSYSVSFKSGSSTKAQSRILQIAKRMEDINEGLELIADDFYDIENENFDKEGNPKWKELSFIYGQWKKQEYPSAKILELTGALRESLISNNGDSVKVLGRNSIKLGSKIPYARKHQVGDPSSNLPARPPIQPNAEMQKRFNTTISKWIKGVVRTTYNK